MSEQNLLNYDIFKTNDYNFDFPIATAALSDQRKVAITTTSNATRNYNAYDYTINQTSSPYYLPPISVSQNTNLTFSSLMHHKELPEQWDDVSQPAIIINDKAQHSQQQQDRHSAGSPSDDQAPTHIVSPEAIREALKEEKEEALGHSQKPFSQYSSFNALKQRRFSSDNSPPSFSIPFSPSPSIKKMNYDDEEEEEEPQTPFPHNNTLDRTNLKKVVPGKLKRPPNAYLLFNRDMRRKLLKASPKMTVAEISKEVGDWWKALPDDKREYYVKEASMLKEEHLKKYPDFIYTRRSKAELAEAKKSSKLGRKSKSESVMLNHSDEEEEKNSVDVYSQPKKSIGTGGQRDPRGRKKKRHKHPFAPKHPMSAYLYYLASVYPKVSLEFPGSTVGPISKSISKTWHAMSNEERVPWKQKADSDKARYAREMRVYMATNNEEQLQKQQQEKQQLLLQQQLQKLLSEEEEEEDEEDVDTDADVNSLAAVVNMLYPILYSVLFKREEPLEKQVMEELPRNLLLNIPLKVPDKLEWTSSLLAYITSSYAEDAEKYKQDATTLDAMRDQALFQPTTCSFALEDLSIYFNQLTFLGSRFPSDINLRIGWFPIFIPQEKTESVSNLNYEKSCVLYRMAGLYSELGCSQNWVSTEGIRKACQHFQNAAGCLNYIKTELVPELRCNPPKDFEMLESLVALMMAQAHECIWQKAVMEHMKYGTVARLAIRVSDFYDLFLSAATPIIPEDWKSYADTKSNFFKAFAQYQKANEAISNGRYGEEIARLNLAKSNNLAAIRHLENATLLNQAFIDQIHTLQQSIDRDLARAEKDNDVVYMESIPEESALAPILRSDMVKPILPNFVLSPNYWLTLADRPNNELFIKRPLFEKLVPFAVHQAASVYSDKKDYIVKVEVIAKNQELKAESEKLLDELCLPYALDIVDTLPKRLVDYAEEVQHEGGIQSLYDMLQKIQTMSRKATNLIEEGFNVIEDENEQDVQLSRQYGKLWARPTSRSLTHNLLTMGGQYNDTVQAAQKADRIVQAKVSNWGKAIAMLSKPTDQVQSYLPTLQADEEYYTFIQENLTGLRVLLDLLQQELNEREKLQDKVTHMADKDDISSHLVTKANELTKGSPIVKLEPEQFASIFEQHLSAYKVFEDQMKVHISKQADLLHKIHDLYGQFSFIVANKSVLNKREKAITNLESAFTKFKEIRTNLVEGIKFYSNYTDTLSQFKDDCNDFALARRLEASELIRDTNPGRLLLLKK
ncbi:hypothetical protein HPULCUR_008926 [Helicostylum pulchrum]|uniref:Uncharacterized protein n=1 Tax=Helicostylum pulchrum TaxID=562976 RepID=A0ABP9Y902_9FUNG